MAIAPLNTTSLSELAAALQGLAQAPNANPAGGGGVAVPGDLFDPAAGANGLAGPPGVLSAPPGILPSVDPTAGTSVYSDYGSAGMASLSPTELSMFQQLSAEDPVAAQEFMLQLKMEKISQLAQEVSNISKARHDAIMAVVANLKG